MTGTDSLPTVPVVDDDRVNKMALAELPHSECRFAPAKDGPSALQRMRDRTSEKIIALAIPHAQSGRDPLPLPHDAR